MKSQKLAELAAIGMVTLGLANGAFAQHNEVRGGGLAVSTAEGLKLYDLVDPTTCTWQSGADLLSSQKEVQAYLTKIGKLNWYLEMKLRAEIQSIDFCWTNGQLREPTTGTPPELMIYQKISHMPIGIRLFNAKAVYAQVDRYEELGPSDKALFIIHEALHSFIPLNAPNRYHALESMVVSISKIQGDSTREGRSFNTAIKRNMLAIPSDLNFISDQSFLQYAFGSYEDRRSMIMSGEVTMLDLLKVRDFEYMRNLSDDDQDILTQMKNDSNNQLLSDFCMKNDSEVISKLDQQSTNYFKMSTYCSTMPAYINRNVSIKNPAEVKAYLEHFYQSISNVNVSVKNNRVILSKGVDRLSGNPAINPQYRYAMEIKAPFQNIRLDDAHPALIQYAKMLAALALAQTPDQWISNANANDAFIKAFNFNELKSKIERTQTPVNSEIQASINNLKAVYTGAIQGMIQLLRNQNLFDHADRMIKLVNESNIGIKAE